MCTELARQGSWFLPFNKGYNDGAGNPPNPHGLKTDYLWKEVLTPAGLTDILENYAQIVEEKDPSTGKKKRTQVFPRYHQLGRRAPGAGRCARARRRQALPDPALGGQRQVELHRLAGAPAHRRARSAARNSVRLGDRHHRPAPARRPDPEDDQAVHAGGRDGGPCRALGRPAPVHRAGQEDHRLDGAEVPFILDEIATEGDKTFAIVIDEAHSSQGGKTSAAMSKASGEGADAADATTKSVTPRTR
jgi:type I restriction enzyme R subunit